MTVNALAFVVLLKENSKRSSPPTSRRFPKIGVQNVNLDSELSLA
jgi:hypothetical protein